ncbi:MAG: ATP-dependent RecD-like DNA helicase, partial [Verrucomicrobiaceae bacterium]|nr:ATP-dependent RecD-like DNA helicase [Verrucomicrobiaceae bacterium]
MPEQTLIGAIERVTFHNEENGYCVLRVKPKDKSTLVTVVGNCPAPKSGEQLVASGEWHEDENYGSQFRAEEITTSEPGTLVGIERYLGSGLIEGIGPVYAKKMVAKFGAEIFDVIDKRSRQLEEIDGIGSKRRKEIKESWQKQKTVRQIMVFLHQYGISTARAVRIYKTYGEQSIRQLRKNPYQLAHDLHGIGFKTADKIAAKLGVQSDTRERISAGLEYVMTSAIGNGHCALPEQELIDSSTELLGIPDGKVSDVLEMEIRAKRMDRDTGEKSSLIFLPYLLQAEQQVAERIKELALKPPDYPDIDFTKAMAWCEKKIGYTLGDGQQQAIQSALQQRMLIITGGPGVGKTTIINTVLMILRAKGITPVLCAPTGRAAKRMGESTGLEAKTIHRLLEYQSPQTGFARTRENPLAGDLFVIDEASMIDLPLMAALLNALPEQAHLLMIGDVDQLPSVGPGNVLADLIESDVVQVARLNEIFRQAAESRIIQAAHDINNGQAPVEFTSGATPSAKSDFFFIERNDPENAATMIIKLLREQIPEKFGLDPVNDVQVLTPMHRGSLGTQSLNRRIQDALNPANEATFEVERFGSCFRTGDR